MDKILVQNYKTSYGELLLGSIDDKLCLCDWRYRKTREAIDKRLCRYFNAEFVNGEHAVIDEAIKLGYSTMLLDTLPHLKEAMALYRSLGFKKRDPYYHNPLPDVVYWELDLIA